MATNVTMSPEQLQELVTSITSAALQAVSNCAPPRSFDKASFSFDGTRDTMRVEEFLSAAAVYKTVNKITDAEAILTLPLILKGEAAIWWQGVKRGIHIWEDFEKCLRHAFAPKKPAYLIYQEVFSCKQPADMLTESFIAKNRALLEQLPTPGLTEEQQLDIIYGQLHIKIREKVHRNTVATFEKLLNAARSTEQLLREKPQSSAISNEDKGKGKKPRCDYCRHIGHNAEDCRKRIRDHGKQPNLWEKKTKAEAASTQAPSPSQPVFSCYGCGAPGVVRSKCPTCAMKKPVKTEQNVDFCSLSIKTDTRPRPMVGIGIYDIVGTAYVDTCAKSSVASYQLYTCLKRRGCHFAKQTVTVTLADGVKRREDILSINLPVKMCNRVIPTTFIVLPESRENKTLLGVGFIQDAGMIINIPQMTWHFVDQPAYEYDLTPEDIEGISMAQIDHSLHEERVLVPRSGMVPPRNEPKEACTADTSIPAKRPRSAFDGTPADYTDYLYADAIQAIAEARVELSPDSAALFPGYTSEDIGISSINLEKVAELRPDLSEKQKKGLLAVLNKNEEVFLPSRKPTLLAEHTIDTGNQAPIAVPPYRLSPVRRDTLKAEISKMLQEGIIEPTSSPWCAPVVMVPKPNGTIRVCVDYRRLNSITVPDAYPMPRIDDLLQEAKPTPFMSTLDLRAGYWQVKVREEDQDKTSFITPFGIYKFNRMPFGLINAPATFQRLIDRVRVMVGGVKILAYLDDLIVLSPTFEEHLKDLDKVMDTLKENNLAVNLDKCHFCCATVKYLGHFITPQGLCVDPAKVAAITELPRPKNLKHLLSFVQTCSWYRRFIPNFSAVSEPLTRLTKKNVSWNWSEAQEKAFKDLKVCLTTAPVLKQADETKPYTVKTDASNYAIGAVLVQGEGEEEHPVEYASRLLIPAEKNYSTTEREALAVVWALDKFRGYIEGSRVTVLTDHQALRWLLSLKTPTGRLARWALLIQAYNIKIEYTPGKCNVVADALSRPHCTEETNSACGLCSIVVDAPSRSPAEIRQEQLKDSHIANVIRALEAETGENAIYWSGKGYVMNNGLLYKYNPEGDREDAQLLVPEHEWKNTLSVYHDDPMAGHYGADKTHQRIARRYYWKGMRRFVEAYVKNCILCQRYKPTNLKPAGLLQTTAVNKRFEMLSFDLFGPLPTTPDGKSWILIVEDLASGWIELFSLVSANAETCATIMINEVFLRYGMPRRIHSDNGPQFVSAVMQKVTYCLGMKHTYTPVYHPAANPVERRNRDLKTQLGILVHDDHRAWADKLACIRFAMNTASSLATGYTPAYLTFARELRTPDDNEHDLKQIVLSENFIPEITPKLLQLSETLKRAKEVKEMKEEDRKAQADKARRPDPGYQAGDLVLANVHAISKTAKGISAKFAPRRDGPYLIKAKQGATSYMLAKPGEPENSIGTFHTSALTPYSGDTSCLPPPVQPIRKRGRPKKNKSKPN